MNSFIEFLGYFFLISGFILLFIGLLSIFKLKTFYKRILASPIIDSAAFLTILLGVILLKGFSYFSLKVIFLLIIGLITNPIISHSLIRSAWISGYKEDIKDDRDFS